MIGLLLAAQLATAEPATKGVVIAGPGKMSCATWMGESADHTAGQVWVLGYWSGMNQFGGPGVGAGTDNGGIWGAVERVCRENPPMPLYVATYIVFKDMKEHRPQQ